MKSRKFSIMLTMIMTAALMLFAPVTEAFAVDVGLSRINFTSQTWFETYIDDYLNNVKPNWYSNYNYVMYQNSSYYINVVLTPKSVSGSYILAKNTVDATYYNDIDEWHVINVCSSANPCPYYAFNSSGAFQVGGNYTTNRDVNLSSSTSYKFFTSNLIVNTYVSQYDLYCDLNCGDFTTVYGPNYGIYNLGLMFPEWYPIPGGDPNEYDPLIEASWGAANWIRDAINDMFQGLDQGLDNLSDVYSSLAYDFADAVDDIMAPIESILQSTRTFFDGLVPSVVSALYNYYNDTKGAINGIGLVINGLFNPGNSTEVLKLNTAFDKLKTVIPCLTEVNNFFGNLTVTTTEFEPMTWTVLGKTIEWNPGEFLFGAFMPWAGLIKGWIRFSIWLPFVILLWKNGQNLLNGGGPIDKAVEGEHDL